MAIERKHTPQHEGEIVVEVVSGPDSHGRHSFDAYWLDKRFPSVVRGQCFHSKLQTFAQDAADRGQTVRILT